MSEFRGKRMTKKYTMEIAAKPAEVFPLLCPEREKAWIDGWAYEMIYSRSGYAEAGCTFKTDLQPEGEAYWIMTRHVPPHTGEYVRFVVGLLYVTLAFELTERAGGTALEAVFTYTGISEKGNEFVVKRATDDFARIMNRMESALNYFIETGKMLKNPV